MEPTENWILFLIRVSELEVPVNMNAVFKEASLVAVPGPKERIRGDVVRLLNSATMKNENVVPA